MSSAVLVFKSRAELTLRQNIRAFVLLCRGSPVLDAERQFECNAWNCGYTRKAKNYEQYAHFSTAEAAEKRSEGYLPEPFLSFAKAVIVYAQDRRPTLNQSARLSALRYLEAALRRRTRSSNPESIDGDVLDAAAELIRTRYSRSVAYSVAGQLELFASLLRECGLLRLRVRWAHALPKPLDAASRISKKEREARRLKRLPSAAAINALGRIFELAQGPADGIVSSVCGLMLCAPERVNEVLRLQRNCIVHGQGRFKGRIGLRWPGSKGSKDTTKWLPSAMAPIAVEAVQRLLTLTDPAHRLVQWYIKNPSKVYLPGELKHLRRRKNLSYAEVAQILWGQGGSEKSARVWCYAHDIQNIPQDVGAGLVCFDDVQKCILAKLPKTFPLVPGGEGVRFDRALLPIRMNELHEKRSTSACIVDLLEYDDVLNRLGNRPGQSSIFERYGFKEDDGGSIVLATHMFRHYLNTLAQLGGLSDAEIAIFSGRKDVRQNAAYNHLTEEEVQRPIHVAIHEHGFQSQVAVVQPRTLVRRDHFPKLGLAAAHTTEYGYCMHDFASEPCQMYRDCLNCGEQECVKGEAHKEASLRAHREETVALLARAQHALSEEEYGADLWVKHQRKTLERIDALIAVFDDPSVPNGARVRLAGTDCKLVGQQVGHGSLPTSA